MSGLPPEWAIERAKALHIAEGGAVKPMAHAFARYIAEHEEEPVDPLLLEAREIAVPYVDALASDIIDGGYDSSAPVCAALDALRRGIEIAKAGAA